MLRPSFIATSALTAGLAAGSGQAAELTPNTCIDPEALQGVLALNNQQIVATLSNPVDKYKTLPPHTWKHPRLIDLSEGTLILTHDPATRTGYSIVAADSEEKVRNNPRAYQPGKSPDWARTHALRGYCLLVVEEFKNVTVRGGKQYAPAAQDIYPPEKEIAAMTACRTRHKNDESCTFANFKYNEWYPGYTQSYSGEFTTAIGTGKQARRITETFRVMTDTNWVAEDNSGATTTVTGPDGDMRHVSDYSKVRLNIGLGI